MVLSFNHIGIAVANLTAAMSWYSNLGLDLYPHTLSIERARDGNHPIFQLNPNFTSVEIAFLTASNGVGIELFEFSLGDSSQGLSGSTQDNSGTIQDSELSGVFHFALTVADPENAQVDIVRSGGQKLGTTIPVGAGGISTYNRDLDGNILEAINRPFSDIPKGVFET